MNPPLQSTERFETGSSIFLCPLFRWLAMWMTASTLGAAPPIAPSDLTELRQELSAVLNNPRTPGVTWGCEVVELTNGTPVFAHNSQRLFTPASCTKLFTAALALDLLGNAFRIVTPLEASGDWDSDGTLRGDLIWRGRGAPDLGAARKGGLDQTLGPLVDGVLRSELRHVTGGVIADESYFRSAPYGPGWDWDDLSDATGAPISALTLHDNVARITARPSLPGTPIELQVEPFPRAFEVLNLALTTGPDTAPQLRFLRLPGSRKLQVTGSLPARTMAHEERLSLPNPALLAATALQDALSRRGIRFERESRTASSLPMESSPSSRSRVVAATTSAPLGELVRDCLKPSQNLHAQLLWLVAGAEFEARSPKSPRPPETDDSAREALKQFLSRLSLGGNDFAIEEGSGLSRKNLVTPSATVTLLRRLHLHPQTGLRESWLAALPIGGVDGTLKNRFTHPPARGNVWAKTGSLRHVHTLAGYVRTAGGHRLAFAVFANGFATSDPAVSGRDQVDRVVELLAAYSGEL